MKRNYTPLFVINMVFIIIILFYFFGCSTTGSTGHIGSTGKGEVFIPGIKAVFVKALVIRDGSGEGWELLKQEENSLIIGKSGGTTQYIYRFYEVADGTKVTLERVSMQGGRVYVDLDAGHNQKILETYKNNIISNIDKIDKKYKIKQ